MSRTNGKVRPDWMGGPSQKGAQAGEVSTADVEQADVAARRLGEEASEEEAQPQNPEAHPEEEGAHGPHEPSYEGEQAAGDGEHENGEPRQAAQNAAPTQEAPGPPRSIKEAISSLCARLSQGMYATTSGAVGKGGDNTRPRQGPSPLEVEKRLKGALRETGVEGFGRVCVGSPKGGVGKSSLAYAIAGALSRATNLRVVLVDAEPNFGATRYLVPRPIEHSVLDLASDAEELDRLADLRGYVSQNEGMGLDVLLNPLRAAEIATVSDLSEAYQRVDSVLSRFYDMVVYDLGLGFRDDAIRRLLSLSDELVLVSDAEVIPNAQLSDALGYVEGLGVDLRRTTLAINHRLPPAHESASTTEARADHASYVRRVAEVPYDAAFSKTLNQRAFDIDYLALPTRLGVLTTAASALEGLRRDAFRGASQKVISNTVGERGGMS